MKKIFLFVILLVILSIANAQTGTEFTKYRWTMDEYGEMSPKSDKAAECYTRVEFDFDNKTIKVFTKTFGSTTISFDSYEWEESEKSYYTSGYIVFYKNDVRVVVVALDSSDDMVWMITFRGNKKIIYAKEIL